MSLEEHWNGVSVNYGEGGLEETLLQVELRILEGEERWEEGIKHGTFDLLREGRTK